jgi:NAD(P)-dependent dehydrogenase (short-subunit alcohol dehydrogenase family)
MEKEKRMELGLKGKVALITGTGSQKGMGKAIALTLAQEGCDIIAVDIDLEGAQKTASEIKSLGRKSIAIRTDITKSTEVNDMAKAALAEFGKIDILVNNAGAIAAAKLFVDLSEAEWSRDINLNLGGMLNCTKAVLPQMLSRKSGKIINISSIGARKPHTHCAVYDAAKTGIVGFTRSLALEVAPSGLNVNAIAPGLTLTAFGGGAPPPDELAKAIAGIPMRRTTFSQDIANMVAFLASDVSSDIAGQTFSVDGGESLT